MTPTLTLHPSFWDKPQLPHYLFFDQTSSEINVGEEFYQDSMSLNAELRCAEINV